MPEAADSGLDKRYRIYRDTYRFSIPLVPLTRISRGCHHSCRNLHHQRAEYVRSDARENRDY